MIFIYFIYLVFGITPPLVWLFYYLKKDKQPESKKMIFKIFLLGFLSTIPTLFIQIQFINIINQLNIPLIFLHIIELFIIIAFVEEFFKFLVVKFMVFKNSEFDEPIDAMIYMIISSLGFATAENILYLISPATIRPEIFNNINYALKSSIIISAGRFLGANFLHTLCSGSLGYFLAKSFINKKNQLRLTIIGLSFATILHGLYNFSIIKSEKSPIYIIITISILIFLIYFVMNKFKKIKKLKSVCKIK